MRWGMVIDLKLCIGCNSCVVACKAGKGTPPGIFLNKVLEEEVGTYPDARRIFWPLRCMQCEEPVCSEVCPTGATCQRADGIVMVEETKCVGCKACVLACPYDARTLWVSSDGYFGRNLIPYEKMVRSGRIRGTAQKCDFCADRLADGLKPHCVQSCLTGALIFGDVHDPQSDVHQALKEGRFRFRLREELGTRPSIYYLAY